MGKHLNPHNFDWEAFKRGEITRICPKCKNPQFQDAFPPSSSKKNGYDHYCKNCTAHRQAVWHVANRDHVRQVNKIWAETHKEQRKQQQRAWWNKYRVENIERVRENQRRARERNRDRDRIRKRENSRNQPWERKATLNCNKRALEKGVPRNMQPADLYDPKTGKLPVFCPIFPHIKLDYNQGPDRRLWASVDRKVPELGYISGNVWVVSMSANTWKSNGSNPTERAKIIKLMTPKQSAPKIPSNQISLF